MANANLKTLNRARKQINRRLKTGKSRKQSTASGQITSLGTARIRRSVLGLYLQWLEDNGISSAEQDHKSVIEIYLEECSEFYQQNTLSIHRNALSKHFKINGIRRFISLIPTKRKKRSYTWVEVKLIIQHQTPKNALATLLCYWCGLRAHEIATLMPVGDEERSTHRRWRDDLFSGLKKFRRYVVTGKGGLKRYVAIPLILATELEKRKIPEKVVRDREINYTTIYDVGFGQSLSQSFSTASKKIFGKSTGIHGLRHSYAKRRLNQLLDQKIKTSDCYEIISQELGHFRAEITFCYLI